MLRKRKNLYINDNKSVSINNEKINYNKNIFSPSKTLFVESKSQTNIFSLNKKIKISLNKFHQYMKNSTNAQRKNILRRPMSLHFNSSKFKKLLSNNNRSEIENDNSYINSHNKYSDSSRAKTSRTLILSRKLNNNDIQYTKINKLNIGLNCHSAKNSSLIINYENSTSSTSRNKFSNIAPLTYNKLKNSKFFANSKYVKGVKNKNKNEKHSPLSTYNINFPQKEKNDIGYKTIDPLIKNQLIKITKKEESTEINNKTPNKKTSIEAEMEKAQFFDLIPMILNQLKQKQTMDDISGEYKKYLSNISKNSSYNNNSHEKINNENNNKQPKIKYLFFENIINSLKHIVKFINIKHDEQLDQSVIKILRSEFSKLNSLNYELNQIKDFLTYGYEYIPKHETMYQKPLNNLVDKGIQVYEFKNFKYNRNKQNKAFFINEKEIGEEPTLDERSNEERRSLIKDFYMNHNILSKKRIFEKIGYSKFNSRNQDNKLELKDDLHRILSSYNTYDSKKEISPYRKANKKIVNSLLKNELLQKLNISTKKFNKIKSKYTKINLKKYNVNEEKGNSMVKLDNSEKNNDTKISSFLALKEHYENIIVNNKGINNEILSNNKNEEINKANDKKEKNKGKKKDSVLRDSLLLSNDIENNENANEEVNNNLDENKEKEEEEKKEKDKDTKNNKDEKKEENGEDKNTIDKIVEKNKNEELDEKTKIYLKNLKERETKNFIKSVENILIALNHLKEKTRPRSPRTKPVYNELLFQKRKQSKDSSNIEGYRNPEIGKRFRKKSSLRERQLDQREISVSSLSDSSMDELKQYIKTKKVKNKTKIGVFDFEKRKIQRRRRVASMDLSQEEFKDARESKKIEELNSKMKQIYEDIHNEKKLYENIRKNKSKKKYAFTFIGVDLNDINDIEKRKKVNLNILKEDVKYKIYQRKISMVEMYNFQNFSRAIMGVNLDKYKNNIKKLKDRLHTLEKYFQLYYNDLAEIERQNEEEKRINKFLYNLKEEIGETIPLVTKYKGFFCRAIDFHKEGDLSKLNPPFEKRK